MRAPRPTTSNSPSDALKAHLPTLMSGRWFSALSDDARALVLSIATVRTVDAGTRLFSRGDPCDGIYAVVDGSVRISALSESGREVLLLVVERPQWFGEIAVFDEKPRTHDAVVDERTTLVHLPARELQTLLAQQPVLWRHLALLMTSKLRLAFIAMEDSASLPMKERVARRLLLMAEGYGEWKENRRRELQVRQEQLAAMLSTTRQTVNQSLKELEGVGAIQLAYGRVEIVDEKSLRRAAGFDVDSSAKDDVSVDD